MIFHTFTSLLNSPTSSLHSSLWSNYPALIVSKWKSRTNRQELPYSTSTFLGIFPVCPPETKEKVCCFSHTQLSISWSWILNGLWLPSSLTFSSFTPPIISYPPDFQSSPFSMGLFSSAHKHDWVSFMPISPSLVPSSLSNYCPLLCIHSQLKVSR